MADKTALNRWIRIESRWNIIVIIRLIFPPKKKIAWYADKIIFICVYKYYVIVLLSTYGS